MVEMGNTFVVYKLLISCPVFFFIFVVKEALAF